MVGAVRPRRAVLSEAGQWPPADRGGADAAPLFLAAVAIALPAGVMCPQSGRQTLQTSQCRINTAQSLRFTPSEQIVMPKSKLSPALFRCSLIGVLVPG